MLLYLTSKCLNKKYKKLSNGKVLKSMQNNQNILKMKYTESYSKDKLIKNEINE